jgi:hypothetical protein
VQKRKTRGAATFRIGKELEIIMVHANIAIPEELDSVLSSIALRQGKKKEEVILDAVKAYVHEEHSPEEILAMRRQARGIWKDRTDLPDFEAIRRSMDRDLNWGNDR